MRKELIFLFIILLLGFALRFYALGQVPISLHRDEAFLGFNGYSILKTGKDISGNFLPLHLESFLFSPAGYSYFSIPFIWLFSLNEFSIRFASAFFGFLTIIVVYLLTKLLFEKHKSKEIIVLFSTFIFSISPWHINLSRTATENTLATFFVSLGILFFILWLKNKRIRYVLASFISFSLTLVIYQAPRPFLPIFLPFMALVLGIRVIAKKEMIFLLGLFALSILLPVFFIIKSPELSYRIRTLNIFEHPQTKIMVTSWLTADGITNLPEVLTRPFHNKIVGYSFVFSENFFNHLSPGFLFFDKGLPDRYRVPSVGLLYLFEIILLPISVIYIVKKSLKIFLFILGWILISFVGSALTFDDIPNLQRTLNAAFPFSILSGLGLFLLYSFISRQDRKFKPYYIFILLFVVISSFGFYIIQYYSFAKIYRPWYRQDGYKELVGKVNFYIEDYKKAVITNRETAPTIFFLLFNKYDPSLFQEETKNKNLSKSDYISFSKYNFTDEECPVRIDERTKRLRGERGVLYVNSGLCEDLAIGTNLLYTVKRIDGSSAFKILEIK